jgi:hypothetical protein
MGDERVMKAEKSEKNRDDGRRETRRGSFGGEKS